MTKLVSANDTIMNGLSEVVHVISELKDVRDEWPKNKDRYIKGKFYFRCGLLILRTHHPIGGFRDC